MSSDPNPAAWPLLTALSSDVSPLNLRGATRDGSAGPPRRLPWVDLAKGGSIALVVLLHVSNLMVGRGMAPSWWHDVNAVLEPIRMPLFFLVAGMFAGSVVSMSWSDVLRRRVLPLVYLYGLWNVLRFGIFMVFPAMASTQETASWWNLATVVVVPHNGLWFLYALVVYLIAARAVRGCSRWLQLGGAVVIAVGSGFADLPWTWANIASLVLYFLLGVHARAVIEQVGAGATWPRAVIAGGVFAGLYTAYRSTVWPPAATLGFVVSCAGLVAGVLLCAKLQHWRPLAPLRALGRRTMPVYLVHELILGVAAVAMTTVVDVTNVAPVVFGPIHLAVIVVAGSLIAYRLLMRNRQYWLFGLPERWRSLVAGPRTAMRTQ